MAERGRTLISRQNLLGPTAKIGYVLMIVFLIVVAIAGLGNKLNGDVFF